MQPSFGGFVWYELMTTDREAAQAFYCHVVGWGAQDAGAVGMTYMLLTTDEGAVAGLMDIPEPARERGARPGWMGYVGVEDVDAAAEKAESLGGSVHVPAQDIPGVGRFAVILDPQGAGIVLFRWSSPDPNRKPAPRGTKGHVGWHELFAVDWSKALSFYSEMFGWTKGEAIDIGEMGTYQLFNIGDEMAGGMFNKPAILPAPFWLYYFNVDDIDAAVARVKERDGQVLNGPMQVPGGDWIAQCMDPQNAMFAIVGKRTAN